MSSPTRASSGADSARARLAALSAEEQADLSFRELSALRRAAFREHADELLASSPEFAAWAAQMEQKFGPSARAYFNVVPWSVAFLVLRYGEDVAQWPTSLAEEGKEVARLAEWTQGRFAAGFGPSDSAGSTRLYGGEEFAGRETQRISSADVGTVPASVLGSSSSTATGAQ